MPSIVSVEIIAAKIFEVRGKKVMLDSELAKLYGVATKRLNEQVRRNKRRFPGDFMFKLTKEEVNRLRSQFVTLNSRSQIATLKRGKNIKYLPYVFTEQGVAMLSSVLNSQRAIKVNIQIMRTFVQIRKMLLTNTDLRRKIEAMEKKYDKQFAVVFEAIRQLLEPPKRVEAIGFEV
ncbi:MAG: ORF6N domain-containing protein [Candidatus Omnitrophota bacterium]